eukprot:COSAG02_NODE_18696_length_924_cov_1.273939_1_plen_194_part_00
MGLNLSPSVHVHSCGAPRITSAQKPAPVGTLVIVFLSKQVGQVDVGDADQRPFYRRLYLLEAVCRPPSPSNTCRPALRLPCSSSALGNWLLYPSLARQGKASQQDEPHYTRSTEDTAIPMPQKVGTEHMIVHMDSVWLKSTTELTFHPLPYAFVTCKHLLGKKTQHVAPQWPPSFEIVHHSARHRATNHLASC